MQGTTRKHTEREREESVCVSVREREGVGGKIEKGGKIEREGGRERRE